MTAARQTIVNESDRPIYVSIEPTPECYELEPGETLTLIYEVGGEGDVSTLSFINEGISIDPVGQDPEVLINGENSAGRSWKFKHSLAEDRE